MKKIYLALAVASTLVMQLIAPVTVFADDSTPPPTETVSGESQSVTQVDPDVDADASEPVDEQPAASDAAHPNEPQGAATLPAENAPDALPDNVNLIVLDENNQALSLASQSAADIVANSDPWWCAEGNSPTTGSCDHYADFSSLISNLHGLGSPTSGTVYIQGGDYAGPETSITFDGIYLPNVSNLSVIGGWDLAGIPPAEIGRTTLYVPLSVTNWTGAVSIKNIDAATTGIDVQTAGAVTVTNVKAEANYDSTNFLPLDGINIKSGSNVTLTNVYSSSNVIGVNIEAGANVVLNNVTSEYNYSDGIKITTNADVALNNVSAQYNYNDGVKIVTHGNVTLKDVSVSYNVGEGVNLSPDAHLVSNDVQATNNHNTRIGVGTGGSEQVAILGGEIINASATCAQKSLVAFNLPNGNNVLVYCPVSGEFSLKNLTRKKLPAPLPDGLTFISGMELLLTRDNQPISLITDAGRLKPSFIVPADQADKTLVILFWDAAKTQWIELPIAGMENSVPLSNGSMVLEGVQWLENVNQIEVGVNFPGIFALAVK